MSDGYLKRRNRVRNHLRIAGKAKKPPKDLHEALYAMSELQLWPDGVDSVSEEQAMIIWRIVETVRASGFPDELRM